MDSLFEKLTGKFGANDVIKANAEAEAKELADSKEKIAKLEEAVSEMRRLSLKCVETNEATGQLVQSAIEKIEEMRGNAGGSDETVNLDGVVAKLEELKQAIDGSFQSASDETHKENVRVYRNVQASFIDELKQQSEAITLEHTHIEERMKGIKSFSIIALIISTISFIGVGMLVILEMMAYGIF